MGNNKDCEICENLIKEKHKYAKLWRILCIIFIVTTVVFAILYFSDIGIGNTKIDVSDTKIGNVVEGDGEASGDNDVAIGGKTKAENSSEESTINKPLIAVCIVAGFAIIVMGVCRIAIRF